MRMLNKVASLILSICMLVGCIQCGAAEESKTETKILETEISDSLTEALGSDDYVVDVSVSYLSKEYLEELQFNSRQTNWFGYHLDDIELQLEGKKWVFTMNETGETTVELFEEYDDTYDIALRNVAIGAGVILVCVTVSVVSGGLGAPAISAIFAASAKTATLYGVSSGAISGVIAGVSTAVQTDGDMDVALKAAAKVGSSSFMWGAISGAVIGGATETITLHSGTANGLTMNEVAQIRNETGWSMDTISRIKSAEEYQIYKDAGLKEMVIDGRTLLVRDINLEYQSELGGEVVTNLERMSLGYAPIDPNTSLQYQLHHVNQDIDGVLAILTTAEHQGNAAILNTAGKEGVQSILGSTWNTQRKKIWTALATAIGGI